MLASLYGGMDDVEQEARRLFAPLAELFFVCVHPKYFTFEQLPVAGGALDQPAWLMALFQFWKGLFAEEMGKKTKTYRGRL